MDIIKHIENLTTVSLAFCNQQMNVIHFLGHHTYKETWKKTMEEALKLLSGYIDKIKESFLDDTNNTTDEMLDLAVNTIEGYVQFVEEVADSDDVARIKAHAKQGRVSVKDFLKEKETETSEEIVDRFAAIQAQIDEMSAKVKRL